MDVINLFDFDSVDSKIADIPDVYLDGKRLRLETLNITITLCLSECSWSEEASEFHVTLKSRPVTIFCLYFATSFRPPHILVPSNHIEAVSSVYSFIDISLESANAIISAIKQNFPEEKNTKSEEVLDD